MSWLKSNAAHAQPIIVANKVQSGVAEITKADFEASIERKIDFTIPYDLKAASNAAKLGKTFVEANPSAKASSVIKQIGERILGASEEDQLPVDEKKSLLGNFDLKSLLVKKKKSKKATEPAA